MKKAGWSDGYDASTLVDEWERSLPGFTMIDSARRALKSFGGLSVVAEGPGRDIGRTSFRIDPTSGYYDPETYAERAREAGVTQLFPIGETSDSGALAIDEEGRVWEFFDGIVSLGSSISEAIEALVLGLRKPTPIKPAES